MTTRPPAEKIRCPRCNGTGYTPLERRRYQVGMNSFWEDCCTCCHGDGVVTESWYRQWRINQADPALRGKKHR